MKVCVARFAQLEPGAGGLGLAGTGFGVGASQELGTRLGCDREHDPERAAAAELALDLYRPSD